MPTAAEVDCAQATAAGVVVVIDIADRSCGGRGDACRNPEGHLGWLGTHHPWKAA